MHMLTTLTSLLSLAPPSTDVHNRDPQDCEEWALTDHSRIHALRTRFGAIANKIFDGEHLRRVLDTMTFRELLNFDRAAFERGVNLVGAVNGSAPGMPYDCDTPLNPGSVHQTPEGCERVQCEGEWNIRSRDQSGFGAAGLPGLVGGGAQATLKDQKPNQFSILPTSWWVYMIDEAIASKPRIFGDIIQVKIRGTDQFMGDFSNTRKFEDFDHPPKVKFALIDSSNGADITLGHDYGVAVFMQAYITMYGMPNAYIG